MIIISENMKSLLRPRLRSLAALVTALIFCVCAGAEEAGDPVLPEETPAVSAAAATPDAADVTCGYLSASGAKLNPFLCNERDMISINSLIYESLFELDENLQPQAVLADSWNQSEDGKTWTIYLRSGVLFHNGVELVAQDVVDTFYMFRNAGDDNPYKGRLSCIEEMAVQDTFVLTVTSKYPGMISLYALTFPVVQRNTLSSNVAMGTGPYWCVGYVEDSYVRLEANPFWWKQQPSVHSINFLHYWDVSNLLTALQSGAVEMMQTRSTSAALTKKLSYCTSMDYSTSTYEVLVPNLSGILSDLNLRKAILYAIDYNTLISNVYLDMAQQCEVPVPPGSWLYESRSAMYYYSPERALQYLNEAGWVDLTGDTMLNQVENGVLKYIDVKILVYDEASSNVRRNAANQIAENLRAVGINASVEVLSRTEVRKAMQNGEFTLALVALNLSESPNLVPLLAAGGDVNYSGYHTDTMDTLLTATLTATTEQEMESAFSDLQMQIAQELPVMGLCFRTGMVLSTRPVAGLSGIRETDAYNGMEFLEQ